MLKARIEVKSDGKCQSTGNLFVEYKQKGRPSGLATTEAQRWAFEYAPDCWIIVPTQRLRGLCRLAYKQKRIQKGGDHNEYEGVLLPIQWLVRPMGSN
jgi:hypothetical protein